MRTLLYTENMHRNNISAFVGADEMRPSSNISPKCKLKLTTENKLDDEGLRIEGVVLL